MTSGSLIGSSMLWVPVLSLILRDLGASDQVIGVTKAIWLVVSASCQYLGGRLADRLGRVPVISWAGIISGLAIAACALSPNWQVFVLLYCIYYGAGGVQAPVFSTITGESVPPAERGRAFSIVERAVGVGVVAGPLIGSFLLPVIGARGLLALSGVVMLFSGLVRRWFLQETTPAGSSEAPFDPRALLRPPLSRVLIVLFSFNAILMLTLWGPFISLHATDVMGLSRPAINQFSAVGSAVGILVTFLVGIVINRYGAPRVLRLALPGLALAALIWSLQSSVALIVAAYIAMSAAFKFCMIASHPFRVQAVPDEIRGRALGTIGLANGLLTAPLVPLASALRPSLGSGAPFYLVLLPAAAGMWAVWSFARATERPAQQVTPAVSSDGDGGDASET